MPSTPFPVDSAPRSAVHILCVDDSLIAVDKPAGVLSVPGRGPAKQDCMATRLQLLFPDARVVHRLDMATSGVMLMARGAQAQTRLGIAFTQRRVSKRYVAVVAGRLVPEAGEIDLPLIADWPNRPKQRVDMANGKPSITRYRVLAYDSADATSRVELQPVTGRSHQLRVHLLALGHPIVGDALYAPAAIQARSDRLMLHACGLSFAHPLSGQPFSVTSDAPF